MSKNRHGADWPYIPAAVFNMQYAMLRTLLREKKINLRTLQRVARGLRKDGTPETESPKTLHYMKQAAQVLLQSRRPIICVSRADSGREVYTGFLSDCPERYLHGLLDSECSECNGEGRYECGDECAVCDGSGREDTPDYTASLYFGGEHDLYAAEQAFGHSSHTLSARCEELDLGDYV